MQRNRLIAAGLTIGFVLVVASCSHQVQTTSGSRYLAAYTTESGSKAAEDTEIIAAADVEPQLRFPARLGLARIDERGLSPVPAAEAEAWMALAGRLGDGYGEFVPVSPLVAALATPGERVDPDTNMQWFYRNRLAETVRQIRLGAARQHLDAVLIYETHSVAEETSNPLAITKVALIGFFLPTENVSAEGFAQAVLVDVRNGYTYGMASAVAEKPVHRMTMSGNTGVVSDQAQHDARSRAAVALTGEVEAMLRELRLALAERRRPSS